jgi:MerR family transcriptional regulator, light-induced transcriptional regulator
MDSLSRDCAENAQGRIAAALRELGADVLDKSLTFRLSKSILSAMTSPDGNDARRAEARHPIGVVAARTGLTPDVLRIWERRYRAVEPQRTDSGQRLYTDADVERLQLLQRGTSGGRSIGQLARLEDTELRELVHADAAALQPPAAAETAPRDAAAYIELALERTARLDAEGLESLLRRLAALWGTATFLDELAAPLFRRIGEEWHEGRLKPAHEHMATAVMRAVLTTLGSELSTVMVGPKLLVATPSGERHEIGALLVASAAAAAGWRVTYLGPDLPASEIAAAALATGARAVAVSIVLAEDPAAIVEELRALGALLPDTVDVLVGGRGAVPLADNLKSLRLHVIAQLPELRDWLRRTA